MTDLPILFSGEMVRAILDGRKTQTRRLVKPQPRGGWAAGDHGMSCDPSENVGRCPYGTAAGDRLWVKETWRTIGDAPLSECTDTGDIDYRADSDDERAGQFKWRPSIFMPRWASRIRLELTAAPRVERLQEISNEDCLAEGVETQVERVRWLGSVTHYRLYQGEHTWTSEPARSYRSLWESINGPGSWEADPYVWVLTFRRLP